jgi:nucleotide-binding universal stress UspA family protein/nitroimidazol reductase NimA-like FMN-containing flavoprotein (pyridoxamine 5'-phosphate oxidase superfamily)
MIEGTGAVDGTSGTGEEHQRRVVVGVDASPAAQAALAWAVEEARFRHCAIHVVHAWQFPAETAAGSMTALVPAGEMKGWAEEVLDDALAAVGVGDDVPVIREACDGAATAVLARACQGAELLVIGTRGHRRLTGLFLGSVSQYLVVHARCPVLVVHVPQGGHEPGEPDGSGGPTEVPAPTISDSTGGRGLLEEIPEEECLALLRAQEFGHLAVVHEGQPLVFPVNYTVDGSTLALRTDPGTKLEWATLGKVAVEVDAIDRATHAGWSVLVRGVGRDITDGVDAWSGHVQGRQLEPWVEGEKEHWVAVTSPVITGRRIRPHAAAAADADAVSPVSG